MRRATLVTALLTALLVPATAHAASSKYLWSTINRCDAAKSTMGIRASMPGNGTHQRMYMRFSAQFHNEAGHWVETGSASRWIRVGTALRRSVQSGYDFAFAPPEQGQHYRLRGTVDFRWTARKGKRRRVVRSERRVTRAGVKGVEGGSPPGRSDPECFIAR